MVLQWCMMHLIRLSALRLALRETVVRKDGFALSLELGIILMYYLKDYGVPISPNGVCRLIIDEAFQR